MRMTNREWSDEWIEAANCLATVTHQLSSAIHEANNLLQVVSGSAEMILMKPALPPDVQKRAETIADHARRVSTLLGGLRDLSRCTPPHPMNVTDLAMVVNGALDLRRHSLTRGRVALTLDGLDAPRPAAIDWRSAMQVVLNMLLNAEDAVLEGAGGSPARREPPAIAVALTAGDGAVTLTVADNGLGAADTDSVYELRRSPDAPPHLGIGLVTARAIAQRCGGAVMLHASSTGTVATLRVPAGRD